jgi:hypothetical protein
LLRCLRALRLQGLRLQGLLLLLLLLRALRLQLLRLQLLLLQLRLLLLLLLSGRRGRAAALGLPLGLPLDEAEHVLQRAGARVHLRAAVLHHHERRALGAIGAEGLAERCVLLEVDLADAHALARVHRVEVLRGLLHHRSEQRRLLHAGAAPGALELQQPCDGLRGGLREVLRSDLVERGSLRVHRAGEKDEGEVA